MPLIGSPFIRKVIVFFFAIAVLPLWISIPARAQEHDMTNVNDVLGGQWTILQNDDVVSVQSWMDYRNSDNPAVTARVSLMKTNDSKLSTPEVVPNYTYFRSGFSDVYATALGWMYNTTNEMVLAFSGVIDSTANPQEFYWRLDLLNPRDSSVWNSKFSLDQSPDQYAPVNRTEQIFMGDFGGTGFDQALLIFASGYALSPTIAYQARIAAASDPQTVGSPLSFGAVKPLQVVASGSGQPHVAIGDFNGDGRKEIAILLPDNQTLQFFSVDSSFNITQTATLALPKPIIPAAMAAGRFRTSEHDDLAIVGQVQGGPTGITVDSVGMTIQSQTPPNLPTYTPALAASLLLSDGQSANDATIKVLAQAAPVQDWVLWARSTDPGE